MLPAVKPDPDSIPLSGYVQDFYVVIFFLVAARILKVLCPGATFLNIHLKQTASTQGRINSISNLFYFKSHIYGIRIIIIML